MKIKKGSKVRVKSLEEIKNSRTLKIVKFINLLSVRSNNDYEYLMHEEMHLLGTVLEIKDIKDDRLIYGVGRTNWIYEELIEEVIE